MREQIAQSIVDFNIMTPKERAGETVHHVCRAFDFAPRSHSFAVKNCYKHAEKIVEQAISEAVAAETERCALIVVQDGWLHPAAAVAAIRAGRTDDA